MVPSSVFPLGEIRRFYSQLGEPGQLEGPDGDLADAVSTEPEDLQGGAQVVQSSELQRADLVVTQVPGGKTQNIVRDRQWSGLLAGSVMLRSDTMQSGI